MLCCVQQMCTDICTHKREQFLQLTVGFDLGFLFSLGFCVLWICILCFLFFVLVLLPQYWPKDFLGRASLQWPILCRVWCKKFNLVIVLNRTVWLWRCWTRCCGTCASYTRLITTTPWNILTKTRCHIDVELFIVAAPYQRDRLLKVKVLQHCSISSLYSHLYQCNAGI